MALRSVEDRVRSICMSFPEVEERRSHGTPAFFVRRQFAMLWPDGHHEHRFPHLWFAAALGVQADLVQADARRFFRPPYVSGRGWVGARLDGRVDWAGVEDLCEDAYRCVAPMRLVALLDGERAAKAAPNQRWR